MKFSDETVENISKRVESSMRRVMLDNEYACLKASLSSLTLADLMQVEEVRELVRWSAENGHLNWSCDVDGEPCTCGLSNVITPFTEAK